MAVPFYLPDEEHKNSSSSQPQSTTKSATPTPPQSLTNEHLVQALYEALSMYSASLLLLNIISHGNRQRCRCHRSSVQR
ncbi:hypothetical protein HA402_002812 [Bradysia odoriphaga]|nr:hypothetical protein HA402_002812 [Bradysia odoriphaga]